MKTFDLISIVTLNFHRISWMSQMALQRKKLKTVVILAVVICSCLVVVWHHGVEAAFDPTIESGNSINIEERTSTKGVQITAKVIIKDNGKDVLDLSLPMQTANRMKAFRDRIRETCKKDDLSNINLGGHKYHTLRALKNDRHRLLYFPIPKIGCSFWKRAFKVIFANKSNVHLFDIPNFKAHDGKDINNMRETSPNRIKHMASEYTSFAFVRDPFSRLFSGYVDKMLVPNKNYAAEARKLFKRYGSQNNEKCGLKISFPAWALYVAESIISESMRDDHFYPMWVQSNPCEINVTHVGKMETFMEDTKYILSSVGININDVTGAQNDNGIKEKNEKGIMADLVQVTIDDVKSRKQKPCLSHTEIFQRMWTVFQIRGQVSKHKSFPHFENPGNISVDGFIQVAWKAYDEFGPRSERSLQREEAMKEAYSLLPKQTLVKLAQAFNTDCTIFDYNCDVEKRFWLSPKPDKLYYFQR